MPGRSEDFPVETPPGSGALTNQSGLGSMAVGRFIRFIFEATATLSSYVPDPDAATSPSTDFAERFKYVIISSSLLDATLSPTSANQANPQFPSLSSSSLLPGSPRPRPSSRASHGHARTNSGNQPNIKSLFSSESSAKGGTSAAHSEHYWRTIYTALATPRNTSVVAAALAFAVNGYIFFGILASLALKSPPSRDTDEKFEVQKSSFESTLEGLNMLIGASNAWCFVVHEAITILEQEERKLFYGPALPHPPSSSLRVALSATLQSTQSHTDNIRQLFAPLTSSAQLTQLSEMYAPPPKSAANSTSGHKRPQSSPNRNSLAFMSSTDIQRSQSTKTNDKRKTWSGANAKSLNRRHSLQGLRLDASGCSSPPGASSAPASSLNSFPSSHTRLSSQHRSALSKIYDEDSDVEAEAEAATPDLSVSSASVNSSPATAHGFDGPEVSSSRSQPKTPTRKPAIDGEDTFTATPPMIKRRKRGSSLTASTPPSLPPPVITTPRPYTADGIPASDYRPLLHSHSLNHLSTQRLSPSSSRISLLQTTRHPLSLAALHEQLQSALASKRFTAAHLLALRFGDRPQSVPDEDGWEELELLDGEDESYWEDVRSVMELLTTSLEDAAGELGNAIDESFLEKARDAVPSPMAPFFPRKLEEEIETNSSRLLSPTLDLNSPSVPFKSFQNRSPRLPSGSTVSFAPLPTPLARYAAHIESLEKALAHAKSQLRECAVLLEQPRPAPSPSRAFPGRVSPNWMARIPLEPALQAWDGLRKDLGTAVRECERGRGSLLDYVKRQTATQTETSDDFLDEEDAVPALGHDHSSNDAEPDDRHPLLPAHEAIYDGLSDSTGSPVIAGLDDRLLDVDPKMPRGIEQVFDYDSQRDGLTCVAFPVREKSTLSRLERIAQMKAKREQQQQRTRDCDTAWGPGGEVVQELKTVISRVEERRRSVPNRRLSILGELATTPEAGKNVVVAPVISNSLPSHLSGVNGGARTPSPMPGMVDDSTGTAVPMSSIGMAL